MNHRERAVGAARKAPPFMTKFATKISLVGAPDQRPLDADGGAGGFGLSLETQNEAERETSLILAVQQLFALHGIAFSRGAVRDLPELIGDRG